MWGLDAIVGSQGARVSMNGERRTAFRCARVAALIGAVLAAMAAPLPGRAGDDASSTPEAAAWEWGPSILLYVLPEEPDFFQPTLTADRGALHLEARYNYEDRETGSAFVGWNLSFGEELRFGLTPMVGGVFGRTNGIAPALTLTLEWGPLALWSQSEYVFDLGDSTASYFYSWSEFSFSNEDWLRVGLAIQRTRAFQTSTQVQGGPLVGVTLWKLSTTAYLFAPGHPDQFVVVAVAGTF
jgi:hypothetical protein